MEARLPGHVGIPCVAALRRSAGAGVAAVALAASGGAAQTWTYIDTRDPQGVPDFTQGGRPICAAAAMANMMWNWTNYAPFNNPASPLVAHFNFANWTQGWRGDSAAVVDRLAYWIYRAGLINATGYGVAGGTTKWLGERKHAYGWWSNPNGLQVVGYYGNEATYAKLMGLVTGPAPTPNIVMGWKWYDALGGVLSDVNGEEYYHALGSAGYDLNNYHALTNGWGDHNFVNGPVVRATYYDTMRMYVSGGKMRFSWADNSTRNGAPGGENWGDYLVRRVGNQANYMQMVAFWTVNYGGSPRIRLERVEPLGSLRNRLFYEVHNPDPEPVHEVFVEVALSFPQVDINEVVASAGGPSGWTARQWRPAGSPRHREVFGITSVSFDAEVLGWEPEWTGVHWEAGATPITQNQTRRFTIDVPASVPIVMDGDALSALGHEDLTRTYFGLVGGLSTCYADCDTSTGVRVLDIFDFLCFQNKFAASDPYACDCDQSTGVGVCDIFDFLCFQNAFALGCP